jgi:hypothetical protein
MIPHRVKRAALVVALVLLLPCPVRLRAQRLGNLAPDAGQQAASVLTGDQQSLANKALCSALGSQVPDPSSASPSLLSNPSVMSVAASSFAVSSKLPLPSATTLLKGYVAQHATDIVASCAVTNASGGLTSKVPRMNHAPSMPNY